MPVSLVIEFQSHNFLCSPFFIFRPSVSLSLCHFPHHQRVDSLELERRRVLDDLRQQMVHTNAAGLKFYGLQPEHMTLVVQVYSTHWILGH